jgi:molybdate transport system substrate-binding protein
VRKITVISSLTPRAVLAEIGAAYERASGCRVIMRPMGGLDVARLVRGGEPVDVVVLASGVVRTLEEEGHLAADGRADLARSPVAFAVRTGAPRPFIADAAAVEAALLTARRIGYSTGPSGEFLKSLVARFGLTEILAPRLVSARPGLTVAMLLARGTVDLGVQQLSELTDHAGVDVVGCLPEDLGAMTMFTAGVATVAPNVADAHAFATFLKLPEWGEVKRRHGMEPA